MLRLTRWHGEEKRPTFRRACILGPHYATPHPLAWGREASRFQSPRRAYGLIMLASPVGMGKRSVWILVSTTCIWPHYATPHPLAWGREASGLPDVHMASYGEDCETKLSN